jgi:hypothetical protein
MSDKENKSFNIVGAWFEFTQLRRDLEERIRSLDVTSFSLQYGTKTETEFRQKLREARLLFEKIEALIGPSTTPPNNVA